MARAKPAKISHRLVLDPFSPEWLESSAGALVAGVGVSGADCFASSAASKALMLIPSLVARMLTQSPRGGAERVLFVMPLGGCNFALS